MAAAIDFTPDDVKSARATGQRYKAHSGYATFIGTAVDGSRRLRVMCIDAPDSGRMAGEYADVVGVFRA